MSDQPPTGSRNIPVLLLGAGLIAAGVHGMLAAAMLQESVVFALLLLAPGLVVLAAQVGSAREARRNAARALAGAVVGALHGLLAATAFVLLGLELASSGGGWAGGPDMGELALYLFALAAASVLEVAASGAAALILVRRSTAAPKG